ncbi:MAG: hypothetical protein RMM17_11260 [Acidobacteriota bacterium]|nr:hypothetical protein [Blastocatellia bacterium]MDW8413249.1 hypothetical protein [Acidobacteriota bacterium]
MLFVFLQNEQQSPVVQPETRQPVDYEHALLLQIDKVLLLLQTVRKDLRAFLKEVNATDKPKEVIDVFRSQLESHAGQLRQCEETLSLLKPPQEATSELHSKLLVGLIKYRRAVETYAEGLAAYDFNVVKQSQLELEQADSEIHLAVERITSNFAK